MIQCDKAIQARKDYAERLSKLFGNTKITWQLIGFTNGFITRKLRLYDLQELIDGLEKFAEELKGG
jgi:hypothetical protein